MDSNAGAPSFRSRDLLVGSILASLFDVVYCAPCPFVVPAALFRSRVKSPSRRRVLFVEDQAELRRTYARGFRGRYEMAFAGTGAEALSLLGAFEPNVVVLDLQLPDTDGIDVLRQLRTTQPELPAVITTAYSSMEPLVEVLGMVHSGYLVKPFELYELAERIDAAA